jgi:NADPH2:quinone reductase
LDYTTNRAELVSRADEIFGWLKAGKLSVSVDTVFPLEQASEGHTYLEAGKSKGKVLYSI